MHDHRRSTRLEARPRLASLRRRRSLWLCSAAAALTLGLAIHFAIGEDAIIALAVGLAAQMVIALFAASIMRAGTAWDDALHTGARWTGLSTLRAIAGILMIGTLLVAAILAIVHGAFPTILPVAAYAACAASLAGWAIDRPPRAPARPRFQRVVSGTRTLYRTRNGAVVADVDERGRPDIVFTGRSNVTRLSEVERAIDARGWQEGRVPANRDLRDALRRWGTIQEGDL